jgi:hypothetical protein
MWQSFKMQIASKSHFATFIDPFRIVSWKAASFFLKPLFWSTITSNKLHSVQITDGYRTLEFLIEITTSKNVPVVCTFSLSLLIPGESMVNCQSSNWGFDVCHVIPTSVLDFSLVFGLQKAHQRRQGPARLFQRPMPRPRGATCDWQRNWPNRW